LKKQSDSVKDPQPTPDEPLKSQLWDNIDPTKVWPKDLSAEWLTDKRMEIQACGGPKANFGKLLTALVVTERKKTGGVFIRTKTPFTMSNLRWI
jgi:hypothetical protein